MWVILDRSNLTTDNSQCPITNMNWMKTSNIKCTQSPNASSGLSKTSRPLHCLNYSCERWSRSKHSSEEHMFANAGGLNWFFGTRGQSVLQIHLLTTTSRMFLSLIQYQKFSLRTESMRISTYTPMKTRFSSK